MSAPPPPAAPAMIKDITPLDLQARLAHNPPLLLDVREDHEVALCALPHAKHIPLAQLAERQQELPHDQEIVIYCHHGGRSMKAARWLADHGFTSLFNLSGGIDEWAASVDFTMARY